MQPSQAAVLYATIGTVVGHAWLAQPPGRSSAWRDGFPTPKNYNDNGLNCGGFSVQHGVYRGRCGVCGDSYGGPRVNEPGPDNVYATGTIVANYTRGQSVAIKIQITASHMGYHEFRLFRNDLPQLGRDASVAVSYYSPNTLLASDGGQTRFDEKDPNIVLKLPTDVVCEACVLQWRWRAGNNWGCDNEGCGLGYGDQEEFYGCADVRIVAGVGAAGAGSSSTLPTATTAWPHYTSPIASSSAAPQRASIGQSTTASLATAQPIQTTVSSLLTSRVTTASTTVTASATSKRSSTTAGAQTTTSTGIANWTCEARKPYAGDVQRWCNINCNRVPRFCPLTHCVCTSS